MSSGPSAIVTTIQTCSRSGRVTTWLLHSARRAHARRKDRCQIRIRQMVGGRGHYLNSRIELGIGVLDLIRTHRGGLNTPPSASSPPAWGAWWADEGGPPPHSYRARSFKRSGFAKRGLRVEISMAAVELGGWFSNARSSAAPHFPTIQPVTEVQRLTWEPYVAGERCPARLGSQPLIASMT